MAESNKEEDRLSSLPDPILTDILSRLPINSAASTSVLSSRWRHLWTAVTCLSLTTDVKRFAGIVNQILPQLSSPKLSEFQLNLSDLTELPDGGNYLESLFTDVFRRNVEYVFICMESFSYKEFFLVPYCLFNSRNLVVLELGGKIKFDLPENGDYVIQLAHLKRLRLDWLVDVPLWLGILIRSCPLLEDLDLRFQLDFFDSQIEGCVDITCPNLNSLSIDLQMVWQTDCTRFNIDSPKLTNLEIRDGHSSYYFVRNPTTLFRAYVDLKKVFYPTTGEEVLISGEVDYLQNTSMFVRGMYSATNLDLDIESSTNVLAYLHSTDDGFPPIFGNLTHFKTTLNGIGLNGWKDLLLSLHCFPKLKHLTVRMHDDPSVLVEQTNWCTPNSVPDCLVSALKRIHIFGFGKSEDELKLVEYILGSASVLEEFRFQPLKEYGKGEYGKGEYERAHVMWKECKFCENLFQLPRCSSTCEIVFSGMYVTASSNTFKKRRLMCQVYLGNC